MKRCHDLGKDKFIVVRIDIGIVQRKADFDRACFDQMREVGRGCVVCHDAMKWIIHGKWQYPPQKWKSKLLLQSFFGHCGQKICEGVARFFIPSGVPDFSCEKRRSVRDLTSSCSKHQTTQRKTITTMQATNFSQAKKKAAKCHCKEK